MFAINGVTVEPTIFPDKTSQIWKIADRHIYNYEEITIHWEFESEAEVFQLCQLVTLLRKSFRNRAIILRCPYLPYARQDKAVSNTTTFARETFLNLLDYLRITRLETVDVHSPIHPAKHTFKIYNESAESSIQTLMNVTGSVSIGYPDSGAMNRYGDRTGPYAVGEKTRDPETGAVKLNAVSFSHDCKPGAPILIVDDICDGGATFIKFATMLKDVGFEDIHLYTSHGIYSKGVQVLRDAGIKRIFNRTGEVA